MDQTLRKMTDACERIKGQLGAANKRLAELDREVLSLREQNSDLHRKMAQAKGSIMLSENNRSADCVSPEMVKRPDSSKLRIRLDDSSHIGEDKLGQSALSADHGIEVENDLDLDESIRDEIPKARAVELIRLREENKELKDKMIQLKHSREFSDAPLGMTTFSAAKDTQERKRNQLEDTD